jgi:predicted acylesterase/phospholipase RssA
MRLMSPAQLNPMGFNPLRAIFAEEIDFEALRHRSCPRLVIAATRLRDGACRVFGNDELTLDILLASCTLPHLHHAIEIGGEAYWDGGFSANPPLRALIDHTVPQRVLLVQLIAPGLFPAPDRRIGLPRAPGRQAADRHPRPRPPARGAGVGRHGRPRLALSRTPPGPWAAPGGGVDRRGASLLVVIRN